MNLVVPFIRLFRPVLFANICLLIVLQTVDLRGQVSGCFRLESPMIAADIGDTVDLPVRAYEFDSLVSIQFTLTSWPPDAFDFIGVTPGNWQADASNFNLAPNRLRFSWFDGSQPAGVALPDSTVLFTMHLRVNDSNLPQHLVVLDDSPQYTPMEVVSMNVPAGPIPVTYEVGNVWTASIVPYDMQLRNTCITGASACNTPDASIGVEATGGISPYTYSWSGPDGFTSSAQNLNNLKPGTYYLMVADQIASTTSGFFKVPQPGQPVAFIPQVTPASCAQNDGCIALTGIFGQAPLTYNWLPVQPNTNQVCGLSPGTYSVTVTGADGCFAVDSITVSAESTLDVHILASHPVCANGQLGTAAAFPLNGLAPYTYLWSNGSADAVVSNLYAGPLALTVTDAAGCTGSDNILIEDPSVQSWGLELVPNCPSSGNPTGNVLLRTVDPSAIAFPLNLYWSNGTWTTVAAAAGDTLDILLTAPSGLYQVTAVDSLGCSQFLETMLACFSPAPPDSAVLVWPGDADNNNAVNHHDLLYLGLAYGASGPVRANASNAWTGQPAGDWPQNTPQLAVNYKNMDTNGDGLINVADTAAILLNWGQVIDPFNDDPFAAPATVPGMAPAPGPALSFAPDTLTPGQTVAIPVVLGTIVTPADSLHGLSFSISYDPKVMTLLYFEPQVSWFGDPAAGLVCIQRHFPGQHRLDVALTRTDGLPADGAGVIGRTFIVIEDDIFVRGDIDHAEGGSGGDDRIITRLNLTNVQALTPGNTEPAIASQATPLVILNTVSTTIPGTATGRLTCQPNPVSEMLRLGVGSETILAVRIFDAFGRVRVDLPDLHQSEIQVPVRGWAAGAYLARVRTKSGVYVKTFICK